MTFEQWWENIQEELGEEADKLTAKIVAKMGWNAALTNTLPKMGIPEWDSSFKAGRDAVYRHLNEETKKLNGEESDRPDGGPASESQQEYFGL